MLLVILKNSVGVAGTLWGSFMANFHLDKMVTVIAMIVCRDCLNGLSWWPRRFAGVGSGPQFEILPGMSRGPCKCASYLGINRLS